MQKTLSIACAALFLSLTACQKGFDLDTPLHDKADTKTAESVAYIKTGDFDLSKSLKNPLQVTFQGTTLTKWADQERYVYLSKPVAQDVTVTVAIGTSEASGASFVASHSGYRVAPEGYAKLSTTTVTIPKGQTKSSTAITVSTGDKYDEISKQNAATEHFVIPVQVSAVVGASSVGVSRDYGTYFIPVKKSYQNVSFFTRDPQGVMLTSADVTYDVSSELSWGNYTYSKDALYDGDPSNEWYAAYGEPAPWVTGILKNGTKKFNYILFKGTDEKMDSFSGIEIFTTQDGTNWTSQGVLPASYFNQENVVIVRFLNPVEAKGVKILGVNAIKSGYFGIGELNFFAEK
ncbi:discoidin domain-containing protein [uncultured Porphyromonas sp.]|uniref:discoidin domain-containing protein n=1 Tax=uncultured Porphyromonas sp. TaxID=159274 RepID=UPI00262BB2AD|nr:discoidin domain-containing protein [uncultured Porphyromonas sp.]